MTRLRRLTVVRDERGVSLIATVLVMLVALSLGALSLRTATHTEDKTAVDRSRSQSLQSAEAAVSTAMVRLALNSACDASVSSTQQLLDGAQVVGRYQVRVDPETGQQCTTTDRVIRAWGTSPTGGQMRKLEVGVRLIPQEGFHYILFAAGNMGRIDVKNNGFVDGDIYAENLDQTKNNIDARSVITPGTIDTRNNAVYLGDLWAGGDVSVRQNGQVGGSITAAGSSATGSVLLENGVVVSKDVKAKGNVSLGQTTQVLGAISQQNPHLPPPPNLDLPAFTWNPANYAQAPVTYPTAGLASTHLATNRNALQGIMYVPDAGGVIDFSGGGTVTGPLTIVTTGKIEFGGTLTGGDHQVVLISLSPAIDAIRVARPSTGAAALDVLLYTPGGVDIKNQTSFTGSIYADKIELKNGVALARSDSLATSPPPGFDFSQSTASKFMVVPVIWREVPPNPPLF